jgi:signal transduction histidine kinase
VAVYPGSVNAMPGTVPTPSRVRSLARQAGQGLTGMLTGPEAPAVRWRSPVQRRAVYVGLAVVTLLACAVNLADLPGAYPDQSSRVLSLAGPGILGNFTTKGYSYRTLLPPGWLPGAPTTAAVLAALAAVAPLPLVARYPMAGWRVAWLALALVPLIGEGQPGWPWGLVELLVLVAAFCAAGTRQQRPVLWWMWALTLVPWWGWAASDGQIMLAAAGTVVFTAIAVAVDALGSRQRDRRALADEAERAELERSRRTVLEERARIARELHDVVAHHMSLIAVRAETAPYRLAGLDQPIVAEFGALSGSAREALTDMRRLLGVLRQDEPAGRAPQPRLSDLPELVETTRRAGVSVSLALPDPPDQVPPGVGLCAYRVVQESLSNASRYAPGSAVSVSVDRSAGAVVVQVVNGPAGGLPEPLNGHAPAAGHRPGHGLAGMRERVALLGGSLSAGASPDGGYAVRAVLPLGPAA